jgi:tripartite-type tricarboxylate transporter receptor subunit TctC
VSGQQFFSARKILLAACFAASVGALAAPAAAQVYPNRPVKIVVPFVPGGPTEFIIRLLADRLTAMLGQPFVIENRPGGAGGTVGAKSVASAEADGYTLLFSSPGPLVTAAAVYRNLDYDPIKSFAPIAMVIYAPQMLVVHPSVPAESLEQLVAYAKRNPGKITFGSSGYGTQPHMLGEMLKRTADINIIPRALSQLVELLWKLIGNCRKLGHSWPPRP